METELYQVLGKHHLSQRAASRQQDNPYFDIIGYLEQQLARMQHGAMTELKRVKEQQSNHNLRGEMTHALPVADTAMGASSARQPIPPTSASLGAFPQQPLTHAVAHQPEYLITIDNLATQKDVIEQFIEAKIAEIERG